MQLSTCPLIRGRDSHSSVSQCEVDSSQSPKFLCDDIDLVPEVVWNELLVLTQHILEALC